MSLRSFYNLLLQTGVLTVIVFVLLTSSFAQVRTSPSYQLQSDSVNFGGGLSTSTSYTLESTAGEVATGDSDSSTYSLRAGYQQMQEVFLSLTGGNNVTMTPPLGGITGGTANGSTSFSVLTDSPSGYELTIVSDNDPAMQNDPYVIFDYVPNAAPNADFTFTTDATDAHFGFSPEGPDIVSYFRDNGSVCSTGGTSDTALACWAGLSTTDIPIARGSANQPNGATTTIHYRVGIGSSAGVIEGTYIATTTLTAIPL